MSVETNQQVSSRAERSEEFVGVYEEFMRSLCDCKYLFASYLKFKLSFLGFRVIKERKHVQNTAKIRFLKCVENVEKWKSPRSNTKTGETTFLPPL